MTKIQIKLIRQICNLVAVGLIINLLFCASANAAGPTSVPTFHSIGLYWSPQGGFENNTCRVEYRKTDEAVWKQGLELWYDYRSITVAGTAHTNEYRGSLVNLQPGTTYEIKLTLDSGLSETFIANTWSENFKIWKTYQIGNKDNALRVDESGNPNDGYIVYDGQGASIDVNKAVDHNIIVNASYVIIRNFILKGAKRDAIEIGESNQNINHVVIEENEISLWGSQGDYNPDLLSSAIRTGNNDGWSSKNYDIRQIIIQRNKIYNPSIDSTYWYEIAGHDHPSGPMAVALFNSGGNHVIRYNHIYSDSSNPDAKPEDPINYYMDILGAGANRSYEGFPTSDTDIYANNLSYAWDDGIESEGANMNVRIWGNYIDRALAEIAVAPTSVGPLYIWRNVSNIAQKYPYETNTGNGVFIKAGGGTVDGTYYGDGRIYIFHNTLLQPKINGYLRGVGGGIHDSGGDMRNTISRNNIIQMPSDNKDCVNEDDDSPTNDFDFDLCFGEVIPSFHEQNGIIDILPIYASFDPINYGLIDGWKGNYQLASSSRGYNEAVLINNFNDNYIGFYPDIGAHEADTPPLEFGVNAYLNGPPMPTIPTSQITAKNLLTAYGTPSSFLDRIIDGLINLLDYTQLVTY